MRRSRTINDEEYELPMTPLIDVVFILIVFFLVGSTFTEIEKDMDIKLPEGSEGVDSKAVKKDIIINIRQDGIIVVDGNIINADELENQLATAVANNPEQIVQIRGDQDAFYKYVTHVMTMCQRHNIHNITVATSASN